MDEITPIILLIFSGLLFRYSLLYAGQAWARTYSQTVTFMVLPVITYVITKTISGNIALSLGMIGALSIVRFRHPVKSAIELIIYFDLITLGIASSVRTKWAIQLVLCTVLIILITKIIQNFLKKHNRTFYNISFNEGNINNVIEITSKKKIDAIEENSSLVNYFGDIESNEHTYKLIFHNKDSLDKFKKEIDSEENIKKINVMIN